MGPLRRDGYLVVSSINMHVTYSNTQLRIETCDECPAQSNYHISVATFPFLTNNTSNESLHFILFNDICRIINLVFTEIPIKYIFFIFSFLNWNFSLNIPYLRFKLFRSFENILMEGTVSQNYYLGPSL